MITNGVVEAQINKVKSLNIKKNFDAIIYARSWGKHTEKPHQLPFIKLLEQLNSEPKNAIMVGDMLETDIKGALNMEIYPIWIDSSKKTISNVKKVNNLEECVCFLKKIL